MRGQGDYGDTLLRAELWDEPGVELLTYQPTDSKLDRFAVLEATHLRGGGSASGSGVYDAAKMASMVSGGATAGTAAPAESGAGAAAGAGAGATSDTAANDVEGPKAAVDAGGYSQSLLLDQAQLFRGQQQA